MARKAKLSNPNTLPDESVFEESTYNPDDFEDIDLPTQEPTGHGYQTLPGVASPANRLLFAKTKLEEQILFNVVEEAAQAISGTKQSGFENIVGVGISNKIVGNQFTNEPCVTVYVIVKKRQEHVAPEAFVPKHVNGVITDVVATGEIFANANVGVYRPAPGGVSVGHYQITAGTLGCLVSRGQQLFVLSNNHVLANSNNGQIGDPILQPGPYDGGKIPDHVIASLSQFVPVDFSGAPNVIDAAIAQASPSLVTPQNKCFGKISTNPIDCQQFMVVKKCGRTTEFTLGLITDCNATVRVGYGTNGTALFQDQIIVLGVPYIAPFSQPGDSGSLVVSLFGNRPVGLLFAGSATHTIVNKISNVLSLLNVSIVS